MKFYKLIFYRSPINHAVRLGNVEIIKLLLTNKKIDVNILEKIPRFKFL